MVYTWVLTKKSNTIIYDTNLRSFNMKKAAEVLISVTRFYYTLA